MKERGGYMNMRRAVREDVEGSGSSEATDEVQACQGRMGRVSMHTSVSYGFSKTGTSGPPPAARCPSSADWPLATPLVDAEPLPPPPPSPFADHGTEASCLANHFALASSSDAWRQICETRAARAWKGWLVEADVSGSVGRSTRLNQGGPSHSI